MPNFSQTSKSESVSISDAINFVQHFFKDKLSRYLDLLIFDIEFNSEFRVLVVFIRAGVVKFVNSQLISIFFLL